jgi:hypothetical protein
MEHTNISLEFIEKYRKLLDQFSDLFNETKKNVVDRPGLDVIYEKQLTDFGYKVTDTKLCNVTHKFLFYRILNIIDEVVSFVYTDNVTGWEQALNDKFKQIQTIYGNDNLQVVPNDDILFFEPGYEKLVKFQRISEYKELTHSVLRASEVNFPIDPARLVHHIPECVSSVVEDNGYGDIVKSLGEAMQATQPDDITEFDPEWADSGYLSETEDYAIWNPDNDSYFIELREDEPIFLKQPHNAKVYGALSSSVGFAVVSDIKKIGKFTGYENCKVVRLTKNISFRRGNISPNEERVLNHKATQIL